MTIRQFLSAITLTNQDGNSSLKGCYLDNHLEIESNVYFPTYCFSEDLTQWYFNNVYICSVHIVKQAVLEDEGFFCQYIYCANDKNLSRDQRIGGYRKQEPL